MRPAVRQRIFPSIAQLQHQNDTVDHSSIIPPSGARVISRENRLRALKLLVGQPKPILHHALSSLEAVKQLAASLGNLDLLGGGSR